MLRHLLSTLELASHDNGASHTELRKLAAKKAYYSAGQKHDGVKLDTAIKIYLTAVEGVIGFGCSSIYISKTNKRMLDTIYCKHLKNIMGLKHSAHSSPILSGLSILPVSVSIALSALTLFKSCFQCSSNTGVLHRLLLKRHNCVNIGKTLLGRVPFFYIPKI